MTRNWEGEELFACSANVRNARKDKQKKQTQPLNNKSVNQIGKQQIWTPNSRRKSIYDVDEIDTSRSAIQACLFFLSGRIMTLG